MPGRDEVVSSIGGTKRIETGAEFQINLDPPELSPDLGSYINPTLGLKVGFSGKWISEPRNMDSKGQVVQRPFLVGAMLVAGQLRERIRRAGRLTDQQIDELIRDCFELILEYIAAAGRRRFNIEAQPHIYEVTEAEFQTLRTPGTAVGPDAIVSHRAVQIF